MSKFPSSTGKVPKGKGGTNRTLDGPGVGTMPKGIDNTNKMNPTACAGGKRHPSAGSVPRTKNPQPVFYSSAGRIKAN